MYGGIKRIAVGAPGKWANSTNDSRAIYRHLGCTPSSKTENKFKCLCHGSGVVLPLVVEIHRELWKDSYR
jgi:hypothetical protein